MITVVNGLVKKKQTLTGLEPASHTPTSRRRTPTEAQRFANIDTLKRQRPAALRA
jgi:hypothetical protein